MKNKEKIFKQLNEYKKKLIVIIVIIACLFVTGCSRDADKVNYNISKDADNFKVRRRIVAYNLRTNDYIFELEGVCSLSTDSDNDLNITCKVGEDKYQKHFIHLTDEVTYTSEQLNENRENKYDYKFVFKPEAIIPIEIVGE